MASSDYKSLNVESIRQAIKEMSARHKLHVRDDKSEDIFTMVLALSAAVKKIFYEKAEVRFSNEPAVEKKAIIQFKRRIRIDAMGKFNAPTVFSSVGFYQNAKALDDNITPLGVIIVYVEREFVPEILRLLKYPYIDYEEDDEVKDGCGALANLLAGYFKRELINLGYKDMEMAPFKSYVNSAQDGVEFPFEQIYKYDVSFDLDGRKRMVVEMVMSYIPRQ